MERFFERLLLLKKTGTFADVATDDLRYVVAELGEEAFAAGERVFDIGDYADRMYLVETGRLGISLSDDPRAADFVSILGPGDCFGEMGLFDDETRSATVHVLDDAVLLTLGRDKLKGLVLGYPQLGLGLLRGMSRRLRGANQLLSNHKGD
jgi:CRP/FNR family transcriptional regulator, cyclic AMP receptor protein